MRTRPGSTLPILAAIAVALAACGGGDKGTGPAPRKATTITKQAATDNQSAPAGTAVASPPAVLVTDQKGAPMSGVSVFFGVTSGGGSITGANQQTNSEGIATVGSWTLGTTAGENHLSASVDGIATSADFTATAVDQCTIAKALAVGTTISGTLAAGDCDISDYYYDIYLTTLAAATPLRITMTSAAFDAYLEVYDGAQGNIVAWNDDGAANSNDADVRILARAGTYIVGATSYDTHEVGPYTIAASTMSSSLEHCDEVWAMTGISTAQTLSATDCQGSAGGYSDALAIVLLAGQTATFTMTSTAVDAFLTLYNGQGTVVATNDNYSGTNARITYTAPAANVYTIEAGSVGATRTGAYTLAIASGSQVAAFEGGIAGRDVAPALRRALSSVGERRPAKVHRAGSGTPWWIDGRAGAKKR